MASRSEGVLGQDPLGPTGMASSCGPDQKNSGPPPDHHFRDWGAPNCPPAAPSWAVAGEGQAAGVSALEWGVRSGIGMPFRHGTQTPAGNGPCLIEQKMGKRPAHFPSSPYPGAGGFFRLNPSTRPQKLIRPGPYTRSTRDRDVACRNCKKPRGTCQRTGWGLPSSTRVSARPKTPWLRPYDERNLTERTAPKRVTFPQRVGPRSPWKTSQWSTPHFSRKYTGDPPSPSATGDSGQMDGGVPRSFRSSKNPLWNEAERGFASSKEFNGSLTKDEGSFSFPLQMVGTTGKGFPTRGRHPGPHQAK
ncbi:hypothetical protein GWK47_019285 [Chionoecetes opilio]|uniref:Uncharacterized protein n=1 Tax=Chionoecetes opilio TaxID=41210 RepID=A0A8J4XQ01_CHIOP|nr:hypothetical protein GWK47_019285 [Chionoecetes opilio]